MENLKQSQQLLAELDALIEKDYQEALELIAKFRLETEELRQSNQISESEFFDLSTKLDTFEINS